MKTLQKLHKVRRSPYSQRGFTLIEMLVVMAIIALLAALLFPVFSTAREHARRSACSSNLQKLVAALQLYYVDNGGYPPDQSEGSGVGLAVLLGTGATPGYLSGPDDFHCPDDLVVGHNSYDGLDDYASTQWPGDTISTFKYRRHRFDDFSSVDFTRQLIFTHPDSDTVVTWCDQHRGLNAGIHTPAAGARDDLVLFLDGKVLPKTFHPMPGEGSPTAPHPYIGTGLRGETDR